MFKINDYVVYNSMGVFKIIDKREDKYANSEEIEYYILEPVYGNNLTVKTPVNNERVLMREIITKDDVSSLISAMP